MQVDEAGKGSLIEGVAKDRRGSREDRQMRHGRKRRSVRVDGYKRHVRQEIALKELHIDRAYLSSHLVRERSDELEVYCKAWPVRQGKHFHKQTFVLDWERQVIRCPAQQEMSFVLGGWSTFPKTPVRSRL